LRKLPQTVALNLQPIQRTNRTPAQTYFKNLFIGGRYEAIGLFKIKVYSDFIGLCELDDKKRKKKAEKGGLK